MIQKKLKNKIDSEKIDLKHEKLTFKKLEKSSFSILKEIMKMRNAMSPRPRKTHVMRILLLCGQLAEPAQAIHHFPRMPRQTRHGTRLLGQRHGQTRPRHRPIRLPHFRRPRRAIRPVQRGQHIRTDRPVPIDLPQLLHPDMLARRFIRQLRQLPAVLRHQPTPPAVILEVIWPDRLVKPRPVRRADQLTGMRRRRAQTDHHGHGHREAEDDEGKVEKVDVFGQVGPEIGRAALRRPVDKVQDHAGDAGDQADHEAVEGARFVAALPENSENERGPDRRREVRGHRFEVEEELAALDLLDQRDPEDGDAEEDGVEEPAGQENLPG